MKITDIDYFAEYGNSLLNRVPAGAKLVTEVFILGVVIFSGDIRLLGGVYLVLLLTILFSSVPKLDIIKYSLYPLIFLALFLVSVRDITLGFAVIVVLKALNASTSLILIIFTTSYVRIFASLKKVLPGFPVNILFMTYRSIFILAKTLDNLLNMLKFRGKPSLTMPLRFLSTMGNLTGFFVIKSVQTGETMYDAMKLRGYND